MTPDGLLRAYFTFREPGAGPMTEHVVVPARRCEECDGKKYEETVRGTLICANHKCREPWPVVAVPIYKTSRRRASKDNRTWPWMYLRPAQRAILKNAREDEAVSLVEVGIVLQELEANDYWRHSARLWTATVLTSSTYEELAGYANDAGWPTRQGGPWTYERVKYWTSRARGEFAMRYDGKTGGRHNS